MTESELVHIETALRIVLPVHHRSFFLNYPQKLIQAERRAGNWRELPSERELYNNPKYLLQSNHIVRMDGGGWLGKNGDPWPATHLVVGDDGCGNYWSVELSGSDPTVWFYDHEYASMTKAYDSLQEFAEFLIQDVVRSNAEFLLQDDVQTDS